MSLRKYQWFLLVFIILGLVYGEYRFNKIELKLDEFQRLQEIELEMKYPVEYLIVTNHKWGSWKENESDVLGIVSFTCNTSQINPILWVNGSAETGLKVTYFWALIENIYSLTDWNYGWIE